MRGRTEPLALGEMRKVELGAPRSSNTGCYEESHEGTRELMGVLEITAVGKSRASHGLSTVQGVQAPSTH